MDRNLPNSATPGAVTGDAYMDAVAERVRFLFDASPLLLSNTGGTANAAVVTCSPPLAAGVVDGMSFWWSPAADNTGPVTMAIDGNPAIAIKSDQFLALAAGQLKAGAIYKLVAFAGTLAVIGSSNIQKVDDYQVFGLPGAFTWNKPAGCPDDALVTGQMWAGGGGGGNATNQQRACSGGGGGGYLRFECRAKDLASTVSGTVGTGGNPGVAGGNTTFGAWTVYGGGAGNQNGSNSSGASGGAGGGALSVGGNGSQIGNSNGLPINHSVGDPTAGAGGGADNLSPSQTVRNGGNGFFGGGGGGGSGRVSGNASGGTGGNSVYGGGGGGGMANSGIGGASVFGGRGGDYLANGYIPAGGGGAGGYGATGRVIIHVIG